MSGGDGAALWREVMLGAAREDRDVAVLYLGRDGQTQCFVRGQVLAVSHNVLVVQRGTGSVGLPWSAVLEVRVLDGQPETHPGGEVER